MMIRDIASGLPILPNLEYMVEWISLLRRAAKMGRATSCGLIVHHGFVVANEQKVNFGRRDRQCLPTLWREVCGLK